MESEIINQLLKPVSGILFLILVLIFVIVSIVLNYHWTNYGVTADKIRKVRTWYFSVSAVLLLIMAVFLAFLLLI